MRLLTFLHAFGPGGVERDALRLWRALGSAGVDVRLVMGRETGAMRAEADGLAWTALDGASDRTAGYETLWMIRHLPRLVQAEQPDLLLCPGNAYSVVAVALRLIMGRRCPPILIKISNDLERRDMVLPVRALYHLWVRLQMHAFAHVIAMAPVAADEIGRIGRVPPQRITTIPNPCFTEAGLARLAAACEERRASGKGTRFLAVGRLARQKNFANLMAAFAAMAGPDDRLVIAGEGAERARLEALAVALGISGRVQLPGHVGDVAPLMAAADVFVLSSDYEGLGVVVLEALAAGLPVVATDCCAAMPDLLAGGAFGALVPPRDSRALAGAMAEVAARVGQGTAWPDRKAMHAMAARFTVEQGLATHLALFQRIAATAAT